MARSLSPTPGSSSRWASSRQRLPPAMKSNQPARTARRSDPRVEWMTTVSAAGFGVSGST